MTAKKTTTAKSTAPKLPTTGGSTTIEDDDDNKPFLVHFRGNAYPLPSLATITFGQMEVLQDLDLSGGLDEIKRIFNLIAPEFTEHVLPNLGPTKLAKVVLDWQTAAGVALPNS